MNIISLFSGAGGMDLDFIKAGFSILQANDFNKDATITYHNNIANHIICGDITKIESKDIPFNDIDIVIGGFPCQGFSVANTKRSIKDERNFLYRELLRVVKDKQPKYFVGENVKGLLSLAKGKIFEMIKNDFKNLGYKLEAKILNSADYGVPQQRERIILIGNRLNRPNPFPNKEYSNIIDNSSLFPSDLKPYKTVKESIEFLYDVDTVEKKIDKILNINNQKIYNHIAYTNVESKFFGRKSKINQAELCDYLKIWRDKKGISTKKIDEYFGYKHTAGHWFRKDNKSGSIPKPKDWWKLKKLLVFCNKYDNLVTKFIEKEITFEQSLRVSNWDRASDTITASSPEIHPNKKRRLSVRECAILQSFPDDFIFYGSLSSQHRQVGNAVPPLFAEKIAIEIKKELLK